MELSFEPFLGALMVVIRKGGIKNGFHSDKVQQCFWLAAFLRIVQLISQRLAIRIEVLMLRVINQPNQLPQGKGTR